MRMCWAAFSLDAEESGWDDFVTSRKSISSSPSLSTSDNSASTIQTDDQQPLTPTVMQERTVDNWSGWGSPGTWDKAIGAPNNEPRVQELDDMDIEMDSESRVQIQEPTTPPSNALVHASNSTSNANSPTTDERVQDMAEFLGLAEPKKAPSILNITGYYPSSPTLNVFTISDLELVSVEKVETEEERMEKELLEDIAMGLNAMSIKQKIIRKQISKPKPPPIGLSLGYKNSKTTPSTSQPRKSVVGTFKGKGRENDVLKSRNLGGKVINKRSTLAASIRVLERYKSEHKKSPLNRRQYELPPKEVDVSDTSIVEDL